MRGGGGGERTLYGRRGQFTFRPSADIHSESLRRMAVPEGTRRSPLPTHETLERVVRKHFPDSTLRSSNKMTGGVSAQVSRIDLRLPDGSDRQFIVREHGPRHCGHAVSVEFQLLDALHKAGLAVPKPHIFDESLSVSSYPYLILEFVDGTTELPPLCVEHSIAAMADRLAVIHQLPTTALPVLPARLDPVPELLEMLPPDAEWQALRARLLHLRASPFTDTPLLLHGDFWPGNLVWKEGAIAAVLDWEDAAIGDPLSDVACTCLELRYVHGEKGAQHFKAAYSRHRALDPFRLALWQAYVAAAGNRSMGDWGLEPARERAMRRIALQSIREAARVIVG